MKLKLLLFIILFSSALNTLGQEQKKRINFILLIDNDIPKTNVYEGYVLIKDSLDTLKDKFSFDYQVGGLLLSNSNYRDLFSKYSRCKIIISFKYEQLHLNESKVFEYEKEIPAGWLNEVYIIFKIYNYSNLESRKKYFLKKNSYAIEINVPGAGSSIPLRK